MKTPESVGIIQQYIGLNNIMITVQHILQQFGNKNGLRPSY